MMRIRLLAASLTVAAAAAACGTDTRDLTREGVTTPMSPLPASEQDRTWMRTAHRAHLTEIRAGHLAERKGTTTEIRSLGTMLVRDHTDLDAELTATARRLGVELPDAPSSRQTLKLDELKSGEGRLFNIQWLTAMTHAHEKAITAAGTEISKGSAAAVRTLAKNALPVLQRHLARMRVAKGG